MTSYNSMTSFFLLAMMLVIAQAKPKWTWVEEDVKDAKTKAILKDMAHMDEARFLEYEEMDDDTLLDAFEADLNMAPTTRRRRDGPPEIDATGLLDLDGDDDAPYRKPPVDVDATGLLDVEDTPIQVSKDEPGDAGRVDLMLSCEEGWVLFGGQCYLFTTEKKSQTQAINYCEIKGGAHVYMPTGNQLSADFVKTKYAYDESPWLQLSEPAAEGKWVWGDGHVLEAVESEWDKGFPTVDATKDCAVMTKNGWEDRNCEDLNNVFCQKDPIGDNRYQFKYCPDGWEYSQMSANEIIGTCYKVKNEEATWAEAFADCKSMNSDLLSVTSDEEFDMTNRITRWPYVWLGLTKQKEVAPFGGWTWTDGTNPEFEGFTEEHENRLKNKLNSTYTELKTGKHPAAPKVEFTSSDWCMKKANHGYCDKRNIRWMVGNRWDDWEMWCQRNPSCKNRAPGPEQLDDTKECSVIDTKLRLWKRVNCNAKKGINYVCKSNAYTALRPIDTDRKLPNHFTQFSDRIGDCTTTDKQLIIAHSVCLKNWVELMFGGGGVAKLTTQCPNFCGSQTKRNDDGSCVWNIACVRCDQLVALCTQWFAKPVCERYIRKNAKKSDNNRCPQFDLCYPKKGIMKEIQKTCLSIYSNWEYQYKTLKYDIEHITYPCDEICSKMDSDCAWKILCKKCTLLMSLSHTGRKEMFRSQFEFIMTKPNALRCIQYTGDIMPAWWVTGNWI